MGDSDQAIHVQVRPLLERDLQDADRIVRVAFGTFLGIPDPIEHMGDAAYVHSRWKSDAVSAFAAEVDGQLAGSNFATRWGSFGFFGPLTLHPDYWNRGFASALVEPVVELFDAWDVTLGGLFTFAESPKHIGLYQKFGFRPRSLTMICEREEKPGDRESDGWSLYSELKPGQQDDALSTCRRLTDSLYSGLDVTEEIRAVQHQSLGDTVMVVDDDLVAFAVCHVGAGSEAGSGIAYIKFGAASSRENFRRLLVACAGFAARSGASHLVAGMNTARAEAYEDILADGFRIQRSGLAMHRPDEPGFSRPGVFVIDDWR